MQEQDGPEARDDARKFRVHSRLGSGGFGEVYKATMVSAGGVRHDVAIKVLHEGLDPRSQAVKRLRDEGKMLGVLRHPAIVRVHDLLVLAGRVSLVTEYIEGSDLGVCFKDDTLPLRGMLDVIGQVASALHAAWYTEGPDGPLQLIHRDVKPANIRIGRHGEVKLLDFGIAKGAGVKREAETQANALIGSYLYMSPERLDRKDGFVPHGDVYSLGAVLYEGIAGARLFGDVDLKDQYKMSWNAGDHDLFIKNKIDEIGELDSRVRDVLTSTLAHDPDERPTAMALSKLCERLADDLPGTTLRRWCRDREWPKVSDDLGELGGRIVTETAFTTGSISSGTMDPMRRSTDDSTEDSTSFAFLDPAAEPGSSNTKTYVAALAGLFAVGLVAFAMASLAVVVMLPRAEAPPVAEVTTDEDGVAEAEKDVGEDAEAGEGTEDEGTDEAPEAAPEPEPEPEAKPVPKGPAKGTVVVAGTAALEFRKGATKRYPGRVPVGTYEVWANFGDGMKPAGMDPINVTSGGTVSIKCSTLRQDCKLQ